jgi:hypothetical protein
MHVKELVHKEWENVPPACHLGQELSHVRIHMSERM